MRACIQYHNAEKLGWVPFGERPFLQTQLAVFTRRPAARHAGGATVYLIVRLGTPARYYLWDAFTADHVEPHDGGHRIWGDGRQLVPPARLEGEAFEAFRRACANFVGFRRVDDHPYRAELARLAASEARELGAEAEAFCDMLVKWRPSSGDPYYHRGCVRAARGDHAGAALDFSEAVRLGTEYAARASAAHAEALARR